MDDADPRLEGRPEPLYHPVRGPSASAVNRNPVYTEFCTPSLVAGEAALTRYQFNTKKNHHYFCRHCGVRAFGIGTETPIGKMYGVNLGCLAGVSEEELSRLTVTYVDGLNDKWQGTPEFSGHL